jgi:hypothetical protein
LTRRRAAWRRRSAPAFVGEILVVSLDPRERSGVAGTVAPYLALSLPRRDILRRFRHRGEVEEEQGI